MRNRSVGLGCVGGPVGFSDALSLSRGAVSVGKVGFGGNAVSSSSGA